MPNENPYHSGELKIQEALGESMIAQRNGRAVSNSIIKGALKFIEQQALSVIGTLGDEGNLWSSILIGEPGWMKAEDDQSVQLDLSHEVLRADDPFWKNIQLNPNVGFLIIELESRRRLRINGVLQDLGNQRFRLKVEESYPNCPKYIQKRSFALGSSEDLDGGRFTGSDLSQRQIHLVRGSDTFFVSSAHQNDKLDLSHRGGFPGFVEVLTPQLLRIPDYSGNSMYNTLGNFSVYPRAGLTFIDFKKSRTLQLTGKPKIQWSLPDEDNLTGGTKRFWDFEIDHWIEAPLLRSLEVFDFELSPHNPKI